MISPESEIFFNDKKEANALFTEINDKNIVHSLNLTLKKEKIETQWKKIKDEWKYVGNYTDESFFEDLKNQQFDIVINATSTGLSDIALPTPDSIFAKKKLTNHECRKRSNFTIYRKKLSSF